MFNCSEKDCLNIATHSGFCFFHKRKKIETVKPKIKPKVEPDYPKMELCLPCDNDLKINFASNYVHENDKKIPVCSNCFAQRKKMA